MKLFALIEGTILFVRGVFSSDSGSPSYSRIASGFALVCAMKWVNAIVAKTQVIPDLLNVLYLVGGLYFINQLPSILGAISASKAGAVQTLTSASVKIEEKTTTP